MSDLIKRSDVLHLLYGIFDKYRMSTDKSTSICESFGSEVFEETRNMPTTYSVDNVVAELEELKTRYFLTIGNTGDEKSDFSYENVGNALDKAIEIVKQVGVSDDVCEWKKSKDYPFNWFVGCDGCEVTHRQGNYCPRCGKKIKVVE